MPRPAYLTFQLLGRPRPMAQAPQQLQRQVPGAAPPTPRRFRRPTLDPAPKRCLCEGVLVACGPLPPATPRGWSPCCHNFWMPIISVSQQPQQAPGPALPTLCVFSLPGELNHVAPLARAAATCNCGMCFTTSCAIALGFWSALPMLAICKRMRSEEHTSELQSH